MAAPITLDFESFYSKKLKYGLKTMIPEEYCRHQLFDCYLLSVSDGSQCWAGHPRDFNWNSLTDATLLSHNRRFDNTVYKELVRRELVPSVQYKEWFCTADLSAFLCNRRALDQASEYLLKTRVDKSYRIVADGKHWNEMNPAEQMQVLEAGRVDAHRSWQIWDKFNHKWPEVERRLSRMTINQGMRGVQINTELLSEYILQTFDMKAAAEKLIPWIRDAEDEDWDEFNTKPTATKCIAEQCRRSKIPCPPVKSKDEEGYQLWETQYGKEHPWIYAVGAWRSINKLHTTFLTVKRRLLPDNTLPFSLKYFGAHTGRWAGDGGVNFQNMRKKPMFCNQDGLMETDEAKINAAIDEHDKTGKWPSWVRYAIDFRALIVPRPGKKMILSDLSQIEPRILAYLSGNTALLDMISKGYGVYEAFARTSMGFTGPWDKKADYYQLFKIQVLQLGYGAGWEKFISTAWTENGIDLTKDDPEWIDQLDPVTGETKRVSGYGQNSRNIVNNFRAKNKKITDLWKHLDNSIKASVGGDFTMELPSGRIMRYENVKFSVKIENDPRTGKPRRKSVVTAEVGGKRKQFYGGKLAENITQGGARDVFAVQMVRMEDRGLGSLYSVHDEAVMEVDMDVTAKDVEHEMSYCPEWLKGCPIAAEAKEVEHYLK